MTCHTQEDYDAVAAKEVFLTDVEGTQVNPHAYPSNSSHDYITCINCHDGHTDKSVTESAKDFCISCHHKDVFQCGTCH